MTNDYTLVWPYYVYMRVEIKLMLVGIYVTVICLFAYIEICIYCYSENLINNHFDYLSLS